MVHERSAARRKSVAKKKYQRAASATPEVCTAGRTRMHSAMQRSPLPMAPWLARSFSCGENAKIRSVARWGYVSGHRCLHLTRRNSCEARQEDEIGVCSRQILRRTKEAKLPRSRPGSSYPGLHRKERNNGKEGIEKRHSIQSRIDLPVLENLGKGGEGEPNRKSPSQG